MKNKLEQKFKDLAKKHNVKRWIVLPSHTMIDKNGKIYSAQSGKSIETFFEKCNGKVVYLYLGRMLSYNIEETIQGFISDVVIE